MKYIGEVLISKQKHQNKQDVVFNCHICNDKNIVKGYLRQFISGRGFKKIMYCT